MSETNVLTPSSAAARSPHTCGFAFGLSPGVPAHIEPVRSRISMMSSGLTEHGKHAVALAVTVSESIPMILAKNVGTVEVDVTVMAFAVA